MIMNNKILIGKIIGTFGIKGELKVYSDSDFKEYRFQVGKKITLSNNQEVEITSFHIHKNAILITINNLNNINLVLEYIGMEIYADKDDVPPLDENEYYLDSLINLEVYNTLNEYLGKVNDVIEIPSGYLLEIFDKQNKKILVPFVDEFIKKVDDKQIIIEEIEGLRS